VLGCSLEHQGKTGMSNEINLFGMKVTEVSSGWKIIIFVIYTLGIIYLVGHFNKWFFTFFLIYAAFTYNALVMGEFWQWTTGTKQNSNHKMK